MPQYPINITLNASTMENGLFAPVLSPNSPMNVPLNASNMENGHFTPVLSPIPL